MQNQQTRSLNIENKNQDRYNQQKSSSLQTEHQEQFRFHEQAQRNQQASNQQRPRYNVPPPNIERNMIINEMNKMGITQKPNTQQDPSEIETNIRAVEQMRQTFRENEKIIKEEIETQYKTQIINLKRINEEQKQANNHNNATSLSKLYMQENTIQELYKQMDQYKEQLEEATSTNHRQRADLSNMSIELINLKVKEDTYIRTIQDLQKKQQSKEDMEQHYIQTIEDNREIMTELESSNHSQIYNEMKLHNELDEARDKIVQLEKDARNISTKSQQEKDNEVEGQQNNNSAPCSLTWDNSVFDQQTEITNNIVSQKKPISTTEKEITKIYENQSKTPQITDQDNSKNELIKKVKTANIAEVSMTLGNQDKLHPTNYLKNYVTA